jgi:hypothetical protein
MISLLADKNIQDYDVIAIQKSWRNFFASISLSSSQNDFHLLYRSRDDIRICFYVNDQISIESWKIEYSTIDLSVLKMIVKEVEEDTKMIRIHNVYNSSLISYTSKDNSITLSKIMRFIVETLDDHHILLKNFNLHHFFWNDSFRSTQHVATDDLLDIMQNRNLTLTLSKDSITWKARNSINIINLTFMTTHLAKRLKHCMTRFDLDQSSNHIFISTKILCDTKSNSSRIARRAWKLIDLNKIKKAMKHALTLQSSITVREIDFCVNKIQKFLRSIVEMIVSWAIFSRHVKSFWNEQYSAAIKDTRKLRRRWSASRDSHDLTLYMKINDRKQKIIQKTKRVNFRQKIEKIVETLTSLWRLVKWAKNKNHQSREVLKMLILKFNDLTTETFDEKAKMFKSVFFSTSSSIELDDISRSFYFRFIECSLNITKRKMLKIIRRIVFDKTSNFDEIINKLFKICALIMMQLLISLFVVCIQQTYHSKTFKKVNIITLKKVDKKDYTISKTYRSIALLNIIEKILKFIMSKKISWIAKTHRLLLDTFMRCRKKRSIETTLKLFIEQIHIVWEQKTNRVITLLSLNVANVFDTMSHVKLIHDMKKRKISRWIIDWISNFLFDRFTILAVNRRVIESFSMQIEISQKFSLFSILYLFYNVDLLKMCNRFETNTRFLEYVDDVNILIYEKSIEENCRNLERVHKLCERWAIRHEFVFASIKYELIHFIKNSKKFDMMITIKIDSNTIQSRIDIRILDVQIDTRLKWDSHVRKIQEKMTKQIMTLTKLSIFIWETIFRKIRMLYIFVIRFVLIYDVFVWHMLKNKKSKMINKLAIIQNRCLRSIFESFRIN